MNDYNDESNGQDKDLEEKFANEVRMKMNEFQLEVEPLLEAARNNLDKAVEASEKYGIPLCYMGICFLNNNYEPSTYRTMWNEVHREIMANEFDIHGNEYGEGWEHSDVC